MIQLDYNPLTGERCGIKFEGDMLHIVNEQDVSGIVDQASDLRNNEDYSKQGMKRDEWHYARIPNAVMLEMKQKHGVDLFASKIDWPAVFRCINTHYPALKATNKHHA